MIIHTQGFDLSWQAQFQVVVCKVDQVRAPVAQHACAEKIKSTPIEGMIEPAKGHFRHRAAPEVVIERFGDRLGLGIFTNTFCRIHEPKCGGLIGFDFDNVFNRTGLTQLLELSCARRAVPLITHLGDHAIFLFRLNQQLRFAEGMGKGFLDIDVLAALHRFNGLHEVHMVGCNDTDCIDIIAHLIEHDTVVGELTHTGKRIEHALFLPLEIDIAKGDWLCGTVFAEFRDHAFCASTDTDTGEIDALAGGKVPRCVGFTERKIGR